MNWPDLYAEVEKALAAATAGPWEHMDRFTDDGSVPIVIALGAKDPIFWSGHGGRDEDCTLAAKARSTWLAALVKRCRDLEAERAEMRDLSSEAP
jgi:hypothetical protein